jgi:hypothetical protein
VNRAGDGPVHRYEFMGCETTLGIRPRHHPTVAKSALVVDDRPIGRALGVNPSPAYCSSWKASTGARVVETLARHAPTIEGGTSEQARSARHIVDRTDLRTQRASLAGNLGFDHLGHSGTADRALEIEQHRV